MSVIINGRSYSISDPYLSGEVQRGINMGYRASVNGTAFNLDSRSRAAAFQRAIAAQRMLNKAAAEKAAGRVLSFDNRAQQAALIRAKAEAALAAKITAWNANNRLNDKAALARAREYLAKPTQAAYDVFAVALIKAARPAPKPVASYNRTGGTRVLRNTSLSKSENAVLLAATKDALGRGYWKYDTKSAFSSAMGVLAGAVVAGLGVAAAGAAVAFGGSALISKLGAIAPSGSGGVGVVAGSSVPAAESAGAAWAATSVTPVGAAAVTPIGIAGGVTGVGSVSGSMTGLGSALKTGVGSTLKTGMGAVKAGFSVNSALKAMKGKPRKLEGMPPPSNMAGVRYGRIDTINTPEGVQTEKSKKKYILVATAIGALALGTGAI